jgi:hypothetical protein
MTDALVVDFAVGFAIEMTDPDVVAFDIEMTDRIVVELAAAFDIEATASFGAAVTSGFGAETLNALVAAPTSLPPADLSPGGPLPGCATAAAPASHAANNDETATPKRVGLIFF